MRFFDDVMESDREKISRALEDINRFGDRFQRGLALFIEESELRLFVGPAAEVFGSGSVQLTSQVAAQRAVSEGELSIADASGLVRMNLARETIDTGGQRGIEGTFVHEGKHALDFARMLATISTGDESKFFVPSDFQKEYSAHLTAAFYLNRRGGEYAQEGLSLGILRRSGGNIAVDPEGIRNRLKKNYGLSPEAPGGTLDMVANPPIRPPRRKWLGLL